MAIVKCPRCELNYILDGEKICTICRRELKGEQLDDDIMELCSECGEHPAVPGGELCVYCLKELQHRSSQPSDDSMMDRGSRAINIDSVSSMNEIELDLDGDFDEDTKVDFTEDLDEDMESLDKLGDEEDFEDEDEEEE